MRIIAIVSIIKSKCIISNNRYRYLLLFIFVFYGAISCFAQQAQCNSFLWNHVYHNYRLIIHDSCTYAIGTVQDIYAEADGDYHIKVKLEPDWAYMLNSMNISRESGDLVCEIICANQITQSDAVQPCLGYTSNVFVPNIGEHVKIIGSYVTDNDHGWNEIHPITGIEITQQNDTSGTTGMPTANTDNVSVNVFPIPASPIVNFQLSTYPASPVFISISNADGQLGGLYQMKANPKFEINTTFFPDGVYYYTAIMDNKLIKSGKFIVVH